jgi:molecular chaperone GrpE
MVQESNGRPDANQVEEPIEEIAALKKEINECKTQAENNLAGWQRAQADFVNFKRRNEQEKEDTVKFANATLVLKILPVLDDFERAIGSLPDDIKGNPWIEGIRLIEKKLRTILDLQGLSPIQAVGQPFDPRLHEAVREVKGKEGIIIEEMERGYKFQDRVIRASKVVVGNGEAESLARDTEQQDINEKD